MAGAEGSLIEADYGLTPLRAESAPELISPRPDSPHFLVLVEWVDSVSSSVVGWQAVSKIAEQTPVVSRSVGWVIAATPEHITLVAHLVEDDCDGDVTIPRACIRRMAPLIEESRLAS